MAIILSKILSLVDYLIICSKVAIMGPITTCICCHTTLWNSNARKQAINDKLQGSVATYLKCGADVNNKIKKGLLLSLSVKKNKIGEYLVRLKEEGGCLVYFFAFGHLTAKRRRTCTLLHIY